jgi:predicted PurR-regulated permease PerM
MANMLKSRKFKSLIPYFLLAVAVILAYKIVEELGFFIDILHQIWGIVTPFFYGLILAYIINIPCGGVERLLLKTNSVFIAKRKRPISMILVFLILAMTLTLILTIIVPAVSRSGSYFIEHFPVYYENTLAFVDYFNSLEILGIYISVDAIVNVFQDMIQNLGFDYITYSFGALIGVSTAVFRGFLAVIAAVYFLIDKDRFLGYCNRALKALTSADVYATTLESAYKINKNFRQYINMQTLDGCILGTAAIVALYIMGSPYALALGIMLGIVNYIPYFGSIFGTLIAVLIVAFTQGISSAVVAAIVLLIIQQIDSNIIQPKLMSGSFSLSPLLVIVSISFGGAVAGLFGMIVAIPIVAFIKDVIESIIAHKERKKAERV